TPTSNISRYKTAALPADRPSIDQNKEIRTNVQVSHMAKDVPVAASGKLQVVQISSAVSRDHIKCSCPDGPPDGENIVLCRVCNQWHHHRCQIGMETLLPKAARQKGFNCTGCKTKARSDSAKFARARDAERRNEAMAQKAADAASAGGSINKRAKRQSGIGGKTKAKRTVRYNEQDDTVANLENEDYSDVEMPPAVSPSGEKDSGTFDKPAPTSILRSRPSSSTRARTQSTRTKTTRRMAMADNSHDRPYQLSAEDKQAVRQLHDLTRKEPCECLGAVVEAGTTLVVCYDCGALHRQSCTGDPRTDNIGRGVCCKDCRAVRERQMKEALKWHEMKKIHDRDLALARQLDEEDNAEDPMKALCAGYLWKTYALQPSISTTSAVVKELTACTWDMSEGRMAPINPAPQSFVDQLCDALHEMLKTAGPENVRKVAGHDGKMLDPEYPEQMMVSLRQLGIMVLHKTEQRMKIQKMGVLAEVLGLATKGTFWSAKMLTKYITSVRTTFSPFNARSGKTARNFLACLPPNARSNMAIEVNMLGQQDAHKTADLVIAFKDGQEMKMDLEKMKLRDVQTEVDRHSRVLRRKEELAG
ncbi:54S ribosomal protein L44, mitochondrial, partial [Teratosphaeria destructans]